ncbi:hypothetical protein SPRG_12262 [Saprolegnia parasitica CBS 223.65]|uniref:EGF-like domain-containing protein n=1 Tax=Saprolegnia parasitica (strain CBS 223.65) TaxID=695850 RepID=A0A067BWH2_SAPPC|nr:hypothetical protein SPRG_12262 [Saprolegnia parasitica CBS 223.65]KDO22623.1 hypothetical protein SPRG_12262 [Saprolegnia parasitica CBS 223.65]|eukprot:XP_012206642.1 hypothetical protein SPRG_12262 [Saprolegnia parasitica CBS 223.65]
MSKLSALWLTAFLAVTVQAQQLQGRCTSNADCAADAACVTVDTGRSAFAKCTAQQPLCGGVTFGHCPSQDAEIGSLMCLFVESDKIRNINCCTSTSGQVLVPAPDGSVVLSSTSTSTTTTTATTTTTSNNGNTTTPAIVRRLQEASSNCLNCYKPKTSNKTIAGSFQCVLKGQCKDQSAFPAVCDTGLSCSTGPTGSNQLCNNHGTCTPTDSDAPEAKYRCLCDVGFGGRFCDKVLSNKCVADCGLGGTCEEGQCKCNSGYSGNQCMSCTSDLACNSINLGGKCNLETNTCTCNNGFGGNFCTVTGDATTPKTNTCLATDATRPNCGTLGLCVDSACYCKGQCVGAICTKCTKPGCTDCVKSAAATQGPSLLLGAAAMAAAWARL